MYTSARQPDVSSRNTLLMSHFEKNLPVAEPLDHQHTVLYQTLFVHYACRVMHFLLVGHFLHAPGSFGPTMN